MCNAYCPVIRNWADREAHVLLHCKLPATFDEYWKAVKTDARTCCRKATRLGYTVERCNVVDYPQMMEIWNSWDEKQHRVMNKKYCHVDFNWYDLGQGWPIKDYGIWTCPDHYMAMYRCMHEGKMVGYVEVLVSEWRAAVHSTMAHKDHINNGVMKLLFMDAIKEQTGKLEEFHYGDKKFLTDQRQWFCKDFLITNI